MLLRSERTEQIPLSYNEVDEICRFRWEHISEDELINVAWIYYYFSVQFRENIEIAVSLFPDDENLLTLDRGERNTDNLSPCPGVAVPGERMDHDEFMRRTLELTVIESSRRRRLQGIGEDYLAKVRAMDPRTRALSIVSYEDGGLEQVFRSILTARDWDGPLLTAFNHFLTGHINLDSDQKEGHGALCRHLPPNDRVHLLWAAFKQSLAEGVPGLTDRGVS